MAPNIQIRLDPPANVSMKIVEFEAIWLVKTPFSVECLYSFSNGR